MKRLATALLFALIAGACTPVVIQPGEARQSPELSENNLISFDGARLPLRSWIPASGTPRAVILALHGFNDYSNAFSDPAVWFNNQNIAVFAYDQRGFGNAPEHGYWHSEAALTGDVTAAITTLKDRYPATPVYLLGVSMGGAVALISLTDPTVRETVAGTILLAPAVWGASTQPWWQRSALWLFAHTMPGLRPSGRGLGKQASDNIEMLRGLGRDPKVIKETRIDAVYGVVQLMDSALAAGPSLRTPALILYGAKDQIIPAEPTRRLLRSLPADSADQRRIAVYPEGWHMLMRDLQGETVWRDIAAWITRPDKPVPSGAEAHSRDFIAGN